MDVQKNVIQQYHRDDLTRIITDAVSKKTGNPDELTLEAINPIEEFHIRGRDSTLELIEKINITPNTKILDVGCGIGGTCRYLAKNFGADVTGIDLSEEYIRTAEDLTSLTNIKNNITFIRGDALSLPFADQEFDVVCTFHAQMNIEDKKKFYSEIHRVLKQGGRFIFYDIFSGVGQVYYPTPWADKEKISWLWSPQKMKQTLTSLGFSINLMENHTELGFEWFSSILKKVQEEGPPPVGLHLLMGENAPQKMKNTARNLEEKRISLFQGVLTK